MRVKTDIQTELIVAYNVATKLANQRESMDISIYNELQTKYQSKIDTLKWVLEESEK